VHAKNEELEIDPVQTLFQMAYVAAVGNPYDPSPDGQHFVFATYPEGVATPLVLVNNWTADLPK
jgi:hypothetical protein